jgi:cell division protein FtsL
MNRSRFLTVSLVLIILFLFLKIYQHNKIFNLMREKQRIVRMKESLRKEKNCLLVELYKLKDQQLVCSRAKKELGMESLKPSQILTITWVKSTVGGCASCGLRS